MRSRQLNAPCLVVLLALTVFWTAVALGGCRLLNARAADDPANRIRITGAVTPELRAVIVATLARLPAADAALIDDIYISPGGGVGMAMGDRLPPERLCGEAWTPYRRIVISADPVCRIEQHAAYYVAHEIKHMRQAADGWPNRHTCPYAHNAPLSYGGYCPHDEAEATAYGWLFGR